MDHTQLERAIERVIALSRQFANLGRLLQYNICLSDNLFANLGGSHLIAAAFENHYSQLFFQFFDAQAQCRLGDKTFLCRPAKVALLRHGQHKLQLDQCHDASLCRKRWQSV